MADTAIDDSRETSSVNGSLLQRCEDDVIVLSFVLDDILIRLLLVFDVDEEVGVEFFSDSYNTFKLCKYTQDYHNAVSCKKQITTSNIDNIWSQTQWQ